MIAVDVNNALSPKNAKAQASEGTRVGSALRALKDYLAFRRAVPRGESAYGANDYFPNDPLIFPARPTLADRRRPSPAVYDDIDMYAARSRIPIIGLESRSGTMPLAINHADGGVRETTFPA